MATTRMEDGYSNLCKGWARSGKYNRMGTKTVGSLVIIGRR